MHDSTFVASGAKKQLLNTFEAAEMLGLKNPNTLTVWRCTKRFPELEYIKIGRLVRYRKDVIESFLKNHTINSSDEIDFQPAVGQARTLSF